MTYLPLNVKKPTINQSIIQTSSYITRNFVTDGKITCRESNFLLSLNLSESVNIDYVKF